MASITDWREQIIAGGVKMTKGGSGESSYHVPIDSMAALLGQCLCWYENGITDEEWGERIYQWGVAAGISKATLHTIAAVMIDLARTLPWIEDAPSSGGASGGGGSFKPGASRCTAGKMAKFLTEFGGGDIDVAPLMAVPGLGKVTAAKLSSDGDVLGTGWEPPMPGQDDTYKIPITSFACLMGHFLVFHQEDIDGEVWGERFFQWGAIIGIGKAQLHPIAMALLAVAQVLPCVPSDTCDGLSAIDPATPGFSPAKSNIKGVTMDAFVEKTQSGVSLSVRDVPYLGAATEAKLAEDHY
jgi:hypothetical protein